MSWIPDRYRELRRLLTRESVREEVDEELALHVALRAEELAASGMSADAARAEALRRFGDLRRYRGEALMIDESMRKEQRRMEVLDAILRETRHAFRSLLRAPLFALIAILTLGVGIGATTSIFTLLDTIVLSPLPYPASERLVRVQHEVPGIQSGRQCENSAANYFYYVDHNRSFEALGAYTTNAVSLSGDGAAERVDAAQVSASLLDVLGARAARGRLFNTADDLPDASPVAVLSHELWTTRYGSDPAIIDRTITINARAVTVIGVMAPGVNIPGMQTRVWLPLGLDRAAPAQNSHYISVIGRLRPDVSLPAALADVQRLTSQLPEQFPNAYGAAFMQSSGFRAHVVTVRDVLLGSIDRVLWLLLAAVAMVLLIACANVANLLLVRAEARRRELTVRTALGAERAHLAVHYLTESLLLALFSGVAGVLLAFASVKLLLAIAPSTLPRLDEVAISGRALVFAFGCATLTGLLFGVAPLLRSRTDFGALREGGRGMTTSRRRQLARNTLVVAQVSLALMLLSAGALLLQSFVNLRNVSAGFDDENVLTFQVAPTFARYPDQLSVLAFHRQLIGGIAALPGVVSVSGGSSVPLSGQHFCSYTTWEGKVFAPNEEPPCMPVLHVLPDYFRTMGIPLTGQPFSWSDLERRGNGVVISRAAAQKLWPGEDPIGKGIISFRDGPPWYRVVAVAEDVRFDGLDRDPVQAIYYPTVAPPDADEAGMWRYLTFVVKTSTSQPEQLTASIRQLIAAIDPSLPLASVRTMRDVVNQSPAVARRSFTMVLLAIAAAMALFLSAVGLYGVIAYLVAQRRSEIGVRMALGARVSQVGALVVLQSVRLAAFGIVIGALGAVWTSRALESLLFGVTPADPRTIAAVATLLLAVAVLASLLPARRAARTNPVEALRST